jgi:hypothetical protein
MQPGRPPFTQLVGPPSQWPTVWYDAPGLINAARDPVSWQSLLLVTQPPVHVQLSCLFVDTP